MRGGAHIKKISRGGTVCGDDVHGGHGESSSIDHAANVAVKADVVEVPLVSSDLHSHAARCGVRGGQGDMSGRGEAGVSGMSGAGWDEHTPLADPPVKCRAGRKWRADGTQHYHRSQPRQAGNNAGMFKEVIHAKRSSRCTRNPASYLSVPPRPLTLASAATKFPCASSARGLTSTMVQSRSVKSLYRALI